MPSSGKRRRGTTSLSDESKKQKAADDTRNGRVIFDKDGDVLISVQSFQHDEQMRTEFQVASKALSLGSTVFNAMFNGRFMESTDTMIGLRTASLLDDDPQALMLLCNIAHLRFTLVPKQVSLDELFNIAVISDKYDMIAMVKPFVEHHCSFHRDDMTEPGNEVYFYIAWVLGQVQDFKRMFMHLAFEIRLPTLTSRLSSAAPSDSSITETQVDASEHAAEEIFKLPAEERHERLNELAIANSEDEDFSTDLPPRAKAAILLIRNDTFRAIQSLCSVYWYGLQRRLMAYATPDHGQYECFAMEFGHLSHILSKWNLHPNSSHVNRSISLRSLLMRLLDYKPLRCIGCKVPHGCCRSEADYKDFYSGLQELETFKTNDREEVVSLLGQVELRNSE